MGIEKDSRLVSEHVNDIYSQLFFEESEYPIYKNHLDGQCEVNPERRAVLVDWINKVHLKCYFTEETFHRTVALINRYLQVV